MIEFKFRAWNKEDEVMIIPDTENNNDTFFTGFDGGKLVCQDLEADDCNKRYILMQFTGLVDNNGKEIYEGDIVKTTIGHKFEIGFIDGKFGCADGGYLMTFGNEKAVVDSCEVIGNIYENKELAYKGCGVTEEGTDNYIKD